MKFVIKATIGNETYFYNELPHVGYSCHRFSKEVTCDTLCFENEIEAIGYKVDVVTPMCGYYCTVVPAKMSELEIIDNFTPTINYLDFRQEDTTDEESNTDFMEINCSCGCKKGIFDDIMEDYYIYKCTKCGETHLIKDCYILH